MKSSVGRTACPLLCGAICVLICAPAMALGPIDGEVGAVWWASQTDSDGSAGFSSSDAGTPGVRGDLWFLQRYGVRAGQYRSSDEGMDSTSIDVMWRAFAPSANNFLAVGLGWQDLQLEDSGGETSGLRLALEGRVGFTDLIQAYAQGAWLPSLDDATGAAGMYQDLDGYEYEVGVAWGAAPFMALRAGWRESTVGFSETTQVTVGTTAFQPHGAGGAIQAVQPQGPSPGQAGVATGSSNGTAAAKGWFLGLGFRF